MNKKLLLTSVMALSLLGANAQSKLSPNSRMLITRQAATVTDRQQVQAKMGRKVLTTILLQDGCEVTDQMLSQLDIQVVKRLSTMLIAYVPVCQLEALADVEGVRLVDTGGSKMTFNDRSRQASSVPAVHAMQVAGTPADLPEQYRGQGVLIAIIDNEIDLSHPAFRRADGSSRIKQAVVFHEGQATSDQTYDLYDEAHIAEAIEATHDCEIIDGHGTHVASIAAGSTDLLPDDHPMKNYYGMAPEADLLMYDIVLDESDADVFFALSNAFDMADQLQRPLVVNMSIGDLSACLDGSDPFSTKLQALFEAYDMNGKIICMSSGNSGHEPMSVQLDCNKPIVDGDWTPQHTLALAPQNMLTEAGDETFFSAEKYINAANLQFCSHDDQPFAVGFELFDLETQEKLASTVLMNTDKARDGDMVGHLGSTASGISYNFNILNASDLTASQRTHLYCNISYNTSVPSYMTVTLYTMSEGMQIDGCAIGTVFPEREGCVTGNNLGSLNQWAATDNVICIGSYNSRHEYEDLLGAHGNTNDEGDISFFSSYRDPYYGTPKPDVTTPGSIILSAYHHNIDWTASRVAGTMMYEGTEHLWGFMQGTSMSSPAAAGIVALWLQANPGLTRDDVMEVIANTSDTDSYCEAAPLRFGAGKMNAKRGIDYILRNATALTAVSHNADTQSVKLIDRNGHIVIRRGDNYYDIIGVKATLSHPE